MILSKASLKRRGKLPPMKSLPEIIENLPKTGLNSPFGYPIKFMPVLPEASEEINEDTPLSLIKQLQRVEAERLSEVRKEANSKVVYDSYEISPYQENYQYNELFKHGLELSNGPLSIVYSGLCSGKGTFNKFISTKSHYNKILIPYYKIESAHDQTLIFESRFESGNLRRAIQM